MLHGANLIIYYNHYPMFCVQNIILNNRILGTSVQRRKWMKDRRQGDSNSTTFWTSTPNWCVASTPWIQDLSLGWNQARMKLGSDVILVTKEVTLFKSTLKYAWVVSLRIARAISTWCPKCWTCETRLLRKHRRPQTYSKQFPCEMHSWLSDYPHNSIHYIIFPLWWV